jgi:DNA (cytosine-5)-methyltransferase 1
MLVLSLFPGIGLLDAAFELEGFCVVRGPDVLWGGDVRRFHPPAGKFDGVIGGPPCQAFSRMRHLNPRSGEKTGNLIPEFERCVQEAGPAWFLMENVPAAPAPLVAGYVTRSALLNNRQLGEVQDRTRRISFGTRDGRTLPVEVAVFESQNYTQAVLRSMTLVPVKIGGSGKVKRTFLPCGAQKGPASGPRVGVAKMLEMQGFPSGMLDDCPLTVEGQRKAVANGVPLPMGRAVARAVREVANGP